MNKWILGARPRTLPAAIAPVVVATALVGADFNWFRAALALKVATTTGAIAAGSVRGRAPSIHLFIWYFLCQSLAINFSNTEQG